jgi:hypothetical protein
VDNNYVHKIKSKGLAMSETIRFLNFIMKKYNVSKSDISNYIADELLENKLGDCRTISEFEECIINAKIFAVLDCYKSNVLESISFSLTPSEFNFIESMIKINADGMNSYYFSNGFDVEEEKLVFDLFYDNDMSIYGNEKRFIRAIKIAFKAREEFIR